MSTCSSRIFSPNLFGHSRKAKIKSCDILSVCAVAPNYTELAMWYDVSAAINSCVRPHINKPASLLTSHTRRLLRIFCAIYAYSVSETRSILHTLPYIRLSSRIFLIAFDIVFQKTALSIQYSQPRTEGAVQIVFYLTSSNSCQPVTVVT